MFKYCVVRNVCYAQDVLWWWCVMCLVMALVRCSCHYQLVIFPHKVTLVWKDLFLYLNQTAIKLPNLVNAFTFQSLANNLLEPKPNKADFRRTSKKTRQRCGVGGKKQMQHRNRPELWVVVNQFPLIKLFQWENAGNKRNLLKPDERQSHAAQF